jgi:membrane protein DedA with SNARE-associated domain
LTQIGVPLPAIPMLVAAGAFVQQGQLAAAGVLAAATVASLLGDAIWYFAGRRHGYRILRTLCRIAIEPDSCVKQTENIFERWGAPSLLVAKYIPGFATVAPPLAGTMRLGFAPFALYSAGGAILWAGVPMFAGMVFHAEVDWLLARLEGMGVGALIMIAIVIGAYVGIKTLERYLLIRFLRMVRVSVEEVREMLRSDERPLVLDARSATARKLDPRHISGAIAVDIAAPAAALPEAAPDRDIVVYCS